MPRGKGKKAKKRIKKIFAKGSKARKRVKRALKDSKITKKEIKKIRKAGASRKQLQKIRKRADRSNKLKIGKRVDSRKEIKKITRKVKPKTNRPANNNRNQRINNPPSNNNNNKPGGGGNNNKPSGNNNNKPSGNNNNKPSGNNNKPYKPTKPPTGLSGVDTTRNRDLYKRGTKALATKAETYLKAFTGKSNLKALRKSALQRMTIKPEEYGREKGKTTLAKRYDKDSDKLIKKLKAPLTNFLKKDKGSELNMFKKGKIQFSGKRMKSFVDSDTDLVSDIKSAAGALGYSAPDNPIKRAAAAVGRIKTPYKKDETLKSKLYKKPTMVG